LAGHDVYVTPATVVFAVGSLACWLVVASTPRVRGSVAFVLSFLGGAEIADALGWIFTGEHYSVLMILCFASVTVLISGILVEEGQPGARPFRYARLRVRFGTLLSGAFSTLTVAAIVFFMFGVWAFGPPASTPSTAGVLPMPASLTVTENADHGCSANPGPQTVCTREIDLQLPGAATLEANSGGGALARTTMRARDIARQEEVFGTGAAHTAVRAMQGGGGWQLTAGGPGAWHGCRSVGWWLDKHTVCTSVSVQSAAAVVTLNVADDWLSRGDTHQSPRTPLLSWVAVCPSGFAAQDPSFLGTLRARPTRACPRSLALAAARGTSVRAFLGSRGGKRRLARRSELASAASSDQASRGDREERAILTGEA
jgi:hypothetical protein